MSESNRVERDPPRTYYQSNPTLPLLQRGKIKLRLNSAMAVLAMLAFAWLVWMSWMYSGLQTRSAMEVAQAARHLAKGDGFSTSVIRPLGFYFSPTIANHPDLVNPPIPTMIVATLFVVTGSSGRVVAFASGIGWLLCGLFVYLLARDLSGHRRIGLLAAVLWSLNTQALNTAVLGEPLIWASAWLTALFYVLRRGLMRNPAVGKRSHDGATNDLRYLPFRIAAVSGVLTGLLALTIPFFVWAVAPGVIYYWLRWPAWVDWPIWRKQELDVRIHKSRPQEYWWLVAGYVLMTAFAAFIVVILPWLIRLGITTYPDPVFGINGFQALMQSEAYPGESVFRYAATRPEPPAVFWLWNASRAMRDSIMALPPLPGVWIQLGGLVPLVVFCLGFFGGSSSAVAKLRFLLVGMVSLAVVVFSYWSVEALQFLLFAPVVTVMAAVTLSEYVAKRYADDVGPVRLDGQSMFEYLCALAAFQMRPLRVYFWLLLLAAIPMIQVRMNLSSHRSFPSVPPGLAYIQQHAQPGDVILTDSPWFVAWYTAQPSVWLPQRRQDYEFMIDGGVQFDWIFIANTRMRDPREIGDWWPELFQSSHGWKEFRLIQNSSLNQGLLWKAHRE